MPGAGHFPGRVFQMEAEIWRNDYFGSQTPANAGIGECPTEKAFVGADFGTGRPSGRAKKY